MTMLRGRRELLDIEQWDVCPAVKVKGVLLLMLGSVLFISIAHCALEYSPLSIQSMSDTL